MTPASPAAGVLDRLKGETRPEHDAIEAALDLASGALTVERYRRTLERFFGYYRPLEEAIHAIDGWAESGLDLGERRKAGLLEADLRALGVGTPDDLPRCRNLPPCGRTAAAFGCLYVLEGATLGGQFISRHVRQTLGVTPETGGRFFHGYGGRTGAMWQAFRTALAAFATTQETQDIVVGTATATFRTLRQWCQREDSA